MWKVEYIYIKVRNFILCLFYWKFLYSENLRKITHLSYIYTHIGVALLANFVQQPQTCVLEKHLSFRFKDCPSSDNGEMARSDGKPKEFECKSGVIIETEFAREQWRNMSKKLSWDKRVQHYPKRAQNKMGRCLVSVPLEQICEKSFQVLVSKLIHKILIGLVFSVYFSMSITF